MKLMAIFGFIASLFGSGCKPAAPAPETSSQAQVMREMRSKMLTTPPEEFGLKATEEFPRVYGVLMDWPLDNATVSVVSLSSGDASIYTTGTFGVIGGIGHEKVRNTAKDCVKAAEKLYDEAVPTNDHPYPRSGHVRFYFVCYDGVRVIDADLESVTGGKDKCSGLFEQAQRVVTELRLIAEKPNG